MASVLEAISRRLLGAFGHVDCEAPRSFYQLMFVLEAFVCASHPRPSQGAPMASAACSLQGPSSRPPWFSTRYLSAATFVCQSHVPPLPALLFHGFGAARLKDNAARFGESSIRDF